MSPVSQAAPSGWTRSRAAAWCTGARQRAGPSRFTPGCAHCRSRVILRVASEPLARLQVKDNGMQDAVMTLDELAQGEDTKSAGAALQRTWLCNGDGLTRRSMLRSFPRHSRGRARTRPAAAGGRRPCQVRLLCDVGLTHLLTCSLAGCSRATPQTTRASSSSRSRLLQALQRPCCRWTASGCLFELQRRRVTLAAHAPGVHARPPSRLQLPHGVAQQQRAAHLGRQSRFFTLEPARSATLWRRGARALALLRRAASGPTTRQRSPRQARGERPTSKCTLRFEPITVLVSSQDYTPTTR